MRVFRSIHPSNRVETQGCEAEIAFLPPDVFTVKNGDAPDTRRYTTRNRRSGADFFARFLGQGGREIAFTGAAADGDDEFSLVFGTLGHLDCGKDVRAG